MRMKDLMNEGSEIADMAIRICRGYLNGPWKKITSDDVTIKRISGGLSNWLYRVRLVDKAAEPSQVLLRFYGQTHGDSALESIITESVIFTLLSERGLGPKLHGVFPGGRIEEYIPARPLKTAELSSPSLSKLIAEKMAAVHTMNVPINKEPRWLWDTINRWLLNMEEIKTTVSSRHQGPITKKVLSMDLHAEANWLRGHLSKVRSPVVFCHNDLQEGNILLHENAPQPTLVLIDFEYCSYNYRGFDLANHFIEWVYDYTQADYPHFSFNKASYPNHQQLMAFIEHYLTTYQAVCSRPLAAEFLCPQALLNEVKHFSLAVHLFWSLWSIVNARVSKIPFGYWEFASHRIDEYFMLKAEMVASEAKEVCAVKRKSDDLN